MTVFWDTNLFIYLIERHPEFGPKVEALAKSVAASGSRIAASTLTLGELLVHPLRQNRSELAAAYRAALTDGSVDLIAFDHDVATFYAQVRARSSMRPPDAVQVACALRAGASVFYTNDKQLWGSAAGGESLDIRGL